jgi:hypothetical protein
MSRGECTLPPVGCAWAATAVLVPADSRRATTVATSASSRRSVRARAALRRASAATRNLRIPGSECQVRAWRRGGAGGRAADGAGGAQQTVRIVWTGGRAGVEDGEQGCEGTKIVAVGDEAATGELGGDDGEEDGDGR